MLTESVLPDLKEGGAATQHMRCSMSSSDPSSANNSFSNRHSHSHRHDSQHSGQKRSAAGHASTSRQHHSLSNGSATGHAESVSRLSPATGNASSNNASSRKGRRGRSRGGGGNHGYTAVGEDLLYEVFPPKVAHALSAGRPIEPERYECVSIFFSDIVGYTDMSAQMAPHEVSAAHHV